MSLPTSQSAIASGDLNRDGVPDLIIGGDPVEGQLGKIRVLLGKGNGNFHPFTEYRVGFNENVLDQAPFVGQIIVYDFNADGKLDVVVSHNGTSTINFSTLFATVLMGNGDGTFQPNQSGAFLPTASGSFITGMGLADYNYDGRMDVVLASDSGSLGKIFGLVNLGNGNFQPNAIKVIGAPIFAMKTAFINNDTKPDVVSVTARGIVILFGENGFYDTQAQVLEFNRFLDNLEVEDFNEDGKPDIIASDSLVTEFRLFLSSENGYPATPIVYPMPGQTAGTQGIDFNEDGHLDLLIFFRDQRSFRIIYGDGKGGFSGSDIFENDLPMSGLAFPDLDNNGKFDLAVSLANYAPDQPQAAVFLQSPNQNRYFTDFTGDAKSDFTVFRPNTGIWWTQNSNDFNFRSINFGISSDKIVPGNYDGDNQADVAVFRNGIWYILRSSDNSLKIDYWGSASDIPVPADYDNDGEMEVAVYRPSEGNWYIKDDNSYKTIKWGIGTDKPVPADYDGDGKADIAVFRPSEGNWYIWQSSNGELLVQRFGAADDKLVPADYDGDGKADISVYRSSESSWYILQSADGNLRYERFGLSNDLPVPSDFDGDNKTDIAVFRASEGNWYVKASRNNTLMVNRWGTAGDLPTVPFANQ